MLCITVTLKIIYHPVKHPAISEHPMDKTVGEGNTAIFSVKAQGEDLNYQWMKNGEVLKEDYNYRDVTTPYLSIKKVTSNHAGMYSCMVSNAVGSLTSHEAKLTVSKWPIILYDLMMQTVIQVMKYDDHNTVNAGFKHQCLSEQ